jgi:hypothetical protein
VVVVADAETAVQPAQPLEVVGVLLLDRGGDADGDAARSSSGTASTTLRKFSGRA